MAKLATPSGQFSSAQSCAVMACLKSDRSGFSMCSWNGRALLALPSGNSFRLRAKKLAAFAELLEHNDLLAVQEVHGSPEEFWAEFGHYMAKFESFFRLGILMMQGELQRL